MSTLASIVDDLKLELQRKNGEVQKLKSQRDEVVNTFRVKIDTIEKERGALVQALEAISLGARKSGIDLTNDPAQQESLTNGHIDPRIIRTGAKIAEYLKAHPGEHPVTKVAEAVGMIGGTVARVGERLGDFVTRRAMVPDARGHMSSQHLIALATKDTPVTAAVPAKPKLDELEALEQHFDLASKMENYIESWHGPVEVTQLAGHLHIPGDDLIQLVKRLPDMFELVGGGSNSNRLKVAIKAKNTLVREGLQQPLVV